MWVSIPLIPIPRLITAKNIIYRTMGSIMNRSESTNICLYYTRLIMCERTVQIENTYWKYKIKTTSSCTRDKNVVRSYSCIMKIRNYILIFHLNWIIVKKSKINAYHGFHIGYRRKTKEQSKSVDIPLNRKD